MALASGVATISSREAWTSNASFDVFDAPDGAQAMMVAEAAAARDSLIVFVSRDAARAADLVAALGFFAPEIPVLEFPAWDCLPYDRVSPSSAVLAARMATLSFLASPGRNGAHVLVTTVNAITQRTPPRAVVENSSFSARVGDCVPIDRLTAFLSANGYTRASTVREAGEFAVRGGLVDLFPPGAAEPTRLDFFGETLETIRSFDPLSQLTTRQLEVVRLAAATEVLLTNETIARFRTGFRAAFGAASDDPVYEAVSAGRKHAGMEHWMPLFYESAATLFDYVGSAALFLEHLAEEAVEDRLVSIADYYAARMDNIGTARSRNGEFSAPAYRPLKPDQLYLSRQDWNDALSGRSTRRISPFSPAANARSFSYDAKIGRTFAAERAAANVNVFEAVRDHVKASLASGKKVYLACWSDGSADRMRVVLNDHGLHDIAHFTTWSEAQRAGAKVATVILGVEQGFETQSAVFLSEQDILGDRLVRRGRRKRAENFLTEAASLSPGDFVVHVDHGVARYAGLVTLQVQGAPHDCLQLEYSGGDKLFLPVENIELLSRFGSDDPMTQLDRLGGAGWQSRKARIKARIKMLAEQLISIAAKREVNVTDAVAPPAGLYDEFCARFPYAETEDQENAIADVMEDLARGRPMDRLICGDVGFGKTEVALRAAFVVAMTGRQVAVVAPTTLLARQHLKNFNERFRGFPLTVAGLSRLVARPDAAKAKAGLADGSVDIVIGTHALLAKSIAFRELGMVIVDEEQHFGVKHKERLKEFRADTHVLTLTATPIPRTLQLAMSGIRDLSLISTPPIDRLSVRTSVGPFDPVVAREILLREHYRGGQSFYVAPRISDLDDVAEFLRDQVPEVKFKIAHGQMSGGELEDIMNAFYDGKFDVLVSTSIIESGLDIPTANTMIVHHSDRFGLGQLYQLRGRVGRSKLRAYAYLTTSPRKALTPAAERRLKVMQSLDTLGAGFTLASHDLDIRGPGNLLGEEQSGQVKEVGVELYQHMLEEAVLELRESDRPADGQWSPQINVGIAVLIPEHYVADLNVRMALYRRLGDLHEENDIHAFSAELVDRFGRLPQEVEQLLQIVAIKELCRKAGVAKIDAGPKGAVISFRDDRFANPDGLIRYISTAAQDVKLRPDQKLVFQQNWPDDAARIKGCRRVLTILGEIAAAA
jgi:transcription-repair coupling factor (superfamily II helicase)